MTLPVEDRLEAVAFDLYSNTSTAVLMHQAVEEIRGLKRLVDALSRENQQLRNFSEPKGKLS